MSGSPKITLYTYFRSSCAARLRIALNLKSLTYTPVHVNLLKGEQLNASYLEINPSGTVPALVVEYPSQKPVTITQSLAALEYLDEIPAGAAYPLLPPMSDLAGRATVRALSDIIVSHVQPVTNLSIQKKIGALGADRTAWAKALTEDRLQGYESIAAKTAGAYSVGDRITMADVCLVPAAWGAERLGVDLKMFPTIHKVVERLEGEEAVKKAHWKSQEDTPEELRG